jgi:ABC-type glycerol-3-phosphate transport system permease component
MSAIRRRPRAAAGAGVLWILAGLALVPMYFVVATALRTGADYGARPGGLPGSATLDNLHALLASRTFYTWLANSAILTSGAVALSIVTAIGAAHALTYFGIPGSELVIKFVAALMIVPLILLLVPLFVQFSQLGLIDSYLGAILIYGGVTLPFGIFMFARFFASVPVSLLEAATLDGAGPLRVLLGVIVPLTQPAIVTVAVVNAFFVWNDLLVALVFLQSDDHRPLLVGITTLAGRESTNIPLVMAGLFLSVLVIVALYAATQRAFVRAIYGGSLHGT